MREAEPLSDGALRTEHPKSFYSGLVARRLRATHHFHGSSVLHAPYGELAERISPPMKRLTLATVAAIALGGCRNQGQQVVDPFWGRTTVPPPATGTIGTVPYSPAPVMAAPATGAPAMTIPGGTLQPSAPPNLLPAPASTYPGSSAPSTPSIPVNPAPAASSTPPPVAPLSGFSSGGVAPYTPSTAAPNNTPSPPPSTYPAPSDRYTPPADRYGAPSASAPAASNTSTPGWGSPAPSTSSNTAPAPAAAAAPTTVSPPAGPMPSGPAPVDTAPPASPLNPAPSSPAPLNSAPSGTAPSNPDYFPKDGMKYHEGQWRPQGGPATSSDVAIVSGGLDTGPSIVRIPTSADGSSATLTSANMPIK